MNTKIILITLIFSLSACFNSNSSKNITSAKTEGSIDYRNKNLNLVCSLEEPNTTPTKDKDNSDFMSQNTELKNFNLNLKKAAEENQAKCINIVKKYYPNLKGINHFNKNLKRFQNKKCNKLAELNSIAINIASTEKSPMDLEKVLAKNSKKVGISFEKCIMLTKKYMKNFEAQFNTAKLKKMKAEIDTSLQTTLNEYINKSIK